VKLKSIRRDQQGATAVEFAITAPIFFMVLFGIIEGGLVLWTQMGLQHATEMAVRCAGINKIVCGKTSDIQNYATQQAYGLNLPASTFSVGTSTCGTTVTAAYTFNFITTYFGSPTVQLNAQACFPS